MIIFETFATIPLPDNRVWNACMVTKGPNQKASSIYKDPNHNCYL